MWDRIDFVNHTITITHTLQRQKQPEGRSKLVLAPPKTARGVRIVPMPLFVEQALARHWERQQQEREKAGASWIDNNLMFCSPTARRSSHATCCASSRYSWSAPACRICACTTCAIPARPY